MKLTKPTIILILYFAFILSANCQLVHFTKHYSIEDGLANRSIVKIIRDDLGKTWLFYKNEIQIYDGASFKTFENNIPYNFEDNIIIGRYGSKDILINKGDQSWVIDTAKETVSKKNIRNKSDYYVSDNTIIEHNQDSQTIQLGDKRTIQFNQNFDIQTIKTSGLNHLGIFTSDSLLYYMYHHKDLYKVGNADKLVGIIKDRLVYIKNDSLFFFDPLSKTSIYHDDDITYAMIRKDKNGNALLATSNGPRRFFDFTLYSEDGTYDYTEVSTPVNTIRDFYSNDFTKDILIASYNGLIYQSFSNYITKYAYKANLNSSRFGNVIWWVIQRETTGDIYFSRESDGFYKKTGNTFELTNPYQNKQENTYTYNYFGAYHASSDKVYSLSFKPEETLLHSWDFVNNPIDIKLPGQYFCLNSEDDRYILIGGSKDSIATVITIDTRTETIKNDRYITSIGNKIYTIKSQGIYTYYGTNTGLYKENISSKHIDTLSQDPSKCIIFKDSLIIVGTDGKGLQTFKDDQLTSIIDKEEGLVNNLVHTLSSDYQGNIWASTNTGISVLDSSFNILKNIRIEDGLGSSELNTGSLLSIRDTTYAGSINGLNAIDHDILKLEEGYPLVLNIVSTTDVNNFTISKNHAGYPHIDVEYDVENFDVHFNDYRLYKSVFNQDYLFQNQFTTNDRYYKLNKNQLPVKLEDNTLEIEHIFNSRSSNIQQTIIVDRKTFFQRFNSIILLSTLVLLLLGLLYFLNRRRLNEIQNHKLKSVTNKLNAMRASALRAQMNPHFIFNALGSIQYYIQRQEIEKAEEYLSDFSVLMRSTLESSKEDYTKISQELEMLTLYLKLEHLRFEEKFTYDIQVDQDLDLTLQIPSMVIQPFIENAVNHGVFHLTDRKGYIKLELHEDKDELIICKISDNGIGRKASKKYRKKKHKSSALANIDERVNIMNSLNDENLTIEITDKIENGHSEGTEVKIQFGIIVD